MGLRLIDKLSGCMYLLVGLVRLHGMEKDSTLSDRAFALAVVALLLLSILVHQVPVLQALPATFFLVMQTLSILKAYQKAGRSLRDAIAWVGAALLVGVALFVALYSYEQRNPSLVDTIMLPLSAEEGDELEDGGEE